MERVDTIVIGAGVVGLAIARELAEEGSDIFVLERHDSFGQETSSRNSEVIHAGIYYPNGYLKHTLSIEGRALLYEYCRRHTIPHKKTGKLIVAADTDEEADLERLYAHGIKNGVSDLTLLSKKEVERLEPEIRAVAAVYSPSTGVIDTHNYMRALSADAKERGAGIVYSTEVTGIEKKPDGYMVTTKDPSGDVVKIMTAFIVNSAGLSSDNISRLAGLDKPEYRIKYCKGDYFRVNGAKSRKITHLVYPVPKKRLTGLGVHATLDLAGGMRLGPDEEYVGKIDYALDPKKAQRFYEKAKAFLPFIDIGDLSADTSGIRPKLQGPEDPVKDFVIKEESDSGFPGFINCIGIESPGLTASLAIARLVGEMVDR